MAISQTMSNPSDWLFQPYQNDFSHTNQNETSPAATFTSAAASRSNNNLIPEQGRVAKPIRRRSRASRRTPTTLLNTDTTNFRAMVQHFTGGPAAAVSFAARQQISNRGAASTLNNYMDHMAAATTTAVPEGFHVQYPNQGLQQSHVFMMENMHGGGGGGSSGVPPQAAAGSGNRINYDNFMI